MVLSPYELILLRVATNALFERVPNPVINGLEQRFPLNSAGVRCLPIFKVNFFPLLYTSPPLQLGQNTGGPFLERGGYLVRGGKGVVNFALTLLQLMFSIRLR